MSHNQRGKATTSDQFVMGTGTTENRVPVAADTPVLFDVDDTNAWKNATFTVLSTVISALTLHPDDDESSIFLIGPVAHAFGASVNAVATKLTDSCPVKAELLAAIAVLTVAKTGGSGDDVTYISKEANGTTHMSTSVTLDMSDVVCLNHINSVVGFVGYGTADSKVVATDDVYIYTDAQIDRATGTYYVYGIFQKIA